MSRPANHATCSYISDIGKASEPIRRCLFIDYIIIEFVVPFQELQQLFEKLDADGDGRVSFQEFLAELFQHNTPGPIPAPGTPRSIGTTPTRSLSAQKKFKYPATAGAEDRTTPSVVQGSGVTGLFSILDPEKTG